MSMSRPFMVKSPPVRVLGVSMIAVIALFSWEGCGPTGGCAVSSCDPGSVCDPVKNVCVEAPRDAGRLDAGRSDGGAVDAGAPDAGLEADAGMTSPCGPCNLAAPLCDPIAKRCVRCTASMGCAFDTPICDTAFQGGLGKCEKCLSDGRGCGGATPVCDTLNAKCVGCLRHTDCPSGLCELAQQRCFDRTDDGGFTFDSGVPFDAGSSFDAGVRFPDGGPLCPVPDGGVTVCSVDCPLGFTCVQNECVLNGKAADLQVTLRWDSTEDLDLHLDEPLGDAGVCEIYYGARTPACAVGSLDLDSQAACRMDLVLIENIIYPQDGGAIPHGTYAVRVDHWTSCSPIQWVPFVVEVRKGGTVSGVCGVFRPSDPDWNTHGGARAGRPLMTFTYP